MHQAVIDQKETESGISIHYVDELYDHGPLIFQVACPVLEEDTPETLAAKNSCIGTSALSPRDQKDHPGKNFQGNLTTLIPKATS